MPRIPDLLELLADLKEQLDRIAGKVDELLADKDVGELPPYVPPVLPTIPPILHDGPVCSVCGMQLGGVIGYVCNNPQCPTGLGSITC